MFDSQMKKTTKPNLGAGPANIRKANLDSVLQLMRKAERFSRTEMARISGISTTTMTKLFVQLEEAGLIELDRIDKKNFGRPRTLYRLATEHICLLSATVEKERTRVSTCDLSGRLNEKTATSFPTGDGLEGFYDRLADAMRKAIQIDGRSARLGSVCLPGLIDRNSGKCVFCSNNHWLENTAPQKELSRRLQIPIHTLSNKKALGLAHQDGVKNFVLLSFSTGVGAGVFCDGHLLSGHSGFAGEIGHITVVPDGPLCGCGNRGCLETVSSDRAFFQALEKQPREQAVEDILTYQSIGVAAAINLFNPQVLYIHSQLADEIPSYLEALCSRAEKRALAPSFAECTIKIEAVGKLEGAALDAVNHTLSQHTN